MTLRKLIISCCFILSAIFVHQYCVNFEREQHQPLILETIHQHGHGRRRLQEKKTLSPGSRATIVMANQMAYEHAKELQKIQNYHDDPLQAMQAMRDHQQEEVKEDKDSLEVIPVAGDAVTTGGDRPEETEQQEDQKERKDEHDKKEEEYQPRGRFISQLFFQKDSNLIDELRKATNWAQLDPLVASSLQELEQIPQIDNQYQPLVQYLGVMVDAGRHFFPVEWLKRLIVILHKLRFNLIHFRLTDDENFIVKLSSYPQLAFTYDSSANNNNNNNNNNKTETTNKGDNQPERNYYTPAELKELVQFAQQHDILMVPEINLPLRASSWAGIPGLLVNCPQFVCQVGHYMPINLDHAEFPTILRAVLNEILEIFDHPKLMHLGGSMSIHDADECFEEAGIIPESTTTTTTSTKSATIQYWEKYERILQATLKDLSYPEHQVIRTQTVESTNNRKSNKDNSNDDNNNNDDDKNNKADENSIRKDFGDDAVLGHDDDEPPSIRIGGVEHYWVSYPTTTISSNENAQNGADTLPASLVSTELDFSVDRGIDGQEIYDNTLQIMQLPQKPMGIIVGTLYLGTDLWLQRNVLGRLIAVALGASHGDSTNTDGESSWSSMSSASSSFATRYNATCKAIFSGPSHKLCDLQGVPTEPRQFFLSSHLTTNREWRSAICQRLTTLTEKRVFKPYKPDRSYSITMGNDLFWKTFHRPPKPQRPKSSSTSQSFKLLKEIQKLKSKAKVKKIGVILDVANSQTVTVTKIQALIRQCMAPLGLDLLQLRLVDDFAFAVQLESNLKLGQSYWSDEPGNPLPPKISDFRQLVDIATTEWNLEVFPEISISTNAGGWVNGGFLVQCPLKYCKEGTGIPNDFREPMFLPVVYAALRELRETFGSSSSYIHLGADERVENLKCFEEDGLNQDEDPPFGAFEAKLKKILVMLGIDPNHVIRWDNDEQLSYEDRVGAITHYRVPVDTEQVIPDIREGEPYFVTVGLLDGTIYSVYKRSRALAVGLSPVAILGEIRTLRRDLLMNQHLSLRLVAFFLGATSSDYDKELSHKEFVKEAVELCLVIQFKDYREDPDCKQVEELLTNEKETAGDDDAAADGLASLIPIATEKLREPLCKKYTRLKSTPIMKEEFVLAQK